MLSVEQKLKHLKTLGILEKTEEIEKMYRGQPFNTEDKTYQQLLEISQIMCEEIKLTSFLIAGLNKSGNKSLEEKLQLEEHRKTLIDNLFPGHGEPFFGNFNNIHAVVGLVDADGFNYINYGINFGKTSLVHLGKYVFVAPKCTFGKETFPLQQSKLGSIEIQNDTWVCACCSFEDGVTVPEKCTIGLNSHVTQDSKMQPQTLVVGNPASSYKKLDKNYESKKEQTKETRPLEEINSLIKHVQSLGINGNFKEFVKMLNCERYNCLDPVMSKIHNLSHTLSDEYNNPNTPYERREEIKDILFFNHGKNFELGNNIYVDVLGAVKVGDNVTINNNVSFAGNAEIGNNVTIKDDCLIQAIGHDPYYKGRHLKPTLNGLVAEVNTSGFIKIDDNLTLSESTKIVPNISLQHNTEEDELVLH